MRVSRRTGAAVTRKRRATHPLQALLQRRVETVTKGGETRTKLMHAAVLFIVPADEMVEMYEMCRKVKL